MVRELKTLVTTYFIIIHLFIHLLVCWFIHSLKFKENLCDAGVFKIIFNIILNTPAPQKLSGNFDQHGIREIFTKYLPLNYHNHHGIMEIFHEISTTQVSLKLSLIFYHLIGITEIFTEFRPQRHHGNFH